MLTVLHGNGGATTNWWGVHVKIVESLLYEMSLSNIVDVADHKADVGL
jgi:hypothetical protein